MRLDQRLVERWIKPNSRVLDLGCGDGDLLATLVCELEVTGYGLEIDGAKINQAIGKGLSILEHDLNKGLSRFADNSFDYVVMTQALQSVQAPDRLLVDMLRIGKEAIITFPNFSYWKTRAYLLFKGRMPVSEALPYMWYNTPNIHLCTFDDFDALCIEHDIHVLNRIAVKGEEQHNVVMRTWPNFFGETAIYRITRL